MLSKSSLLILVVIQVLISGSQSKPGWVLAPDTWEGDWRGNDDSNIKNINCDSSSGEIYWPHPTNCHMYIQCTSSGPAERNCAPGTAWSQSLLICNQEANAQCTTSTTLIPPRKSVSDECVDISPNCDRNAFQCDTNTYVQEMCKKTCNLTCNSEPECPLPWVRLGGECFLFVNEVEEHRNWSEASAYCKNQAREADLAQPKDLSIMADYMLDNGHATLIWTNTTFGCIRGNDKKTLSNITSFEDCKDACAGEQSFTCRSVEYFPPNEECRLSETTSSNVNYEQPCASDNEDHLFAEIKIVSGYWLGGSDLATEGVWSWINGDSITTGWRKGEPNNHKGTYSGGEDCLEKRPEFGANSLNDMICGEKASFICELH